MLSVYRFPSFSIRPPVVTLAQLLIVTTVGPAEEGKQKVTEGTKKKELEEEQKQHVPLQSPPSLPPPTSHAGDISEEKVAQKAEIHVCFAAAFQRCPPRHFSRHGLLWGAR